jgi:hypothetical protein
MSKTPSKEKTDKTHTRSSVVPLAHPEGLTVLRSMNFTVPEQFHREFKLYAVQHGMSMVDLLRESFAVLRKTRGA